MNSKILKIFSVILLLCGFLIPMYSIFPTGLIPNKESWFFIETFGAFAERGLEAFNYIGVVFHLAVWLPGIILCIGAFAKRKTMVRASSIAGIALLLIGLMLAVVITGEIGLVHPASGYICIGYWVNLILFVVCMVFSFKSRKSEK